MNSFSEYHKQIYSPKTREYFREVISSFNNDNLRSATVMLYSLVICDILFKLQELKDMYNDKVAEDILNEINKSRNENDNKQKSLWEKELLKNVKSSTKLLEEDAFYNIMHLYDHRNFSAHPALNADYDLFSPNKETVAAHIRNMLEGVFVKPPVFITKIVDLLTVDLTEKQDVYLNDYEGLKKYLNNKYFSRMAEKMFVSTFKAMWKFVYILDNEDCKKNLQINNLCLKIMLELKNQWLLNHIKNNDYYCNIKIDEDRAIEMVKLCCNIVSLYDCFSEDLKTQLDFIWEKAEPQTYPVHWFKSGSFDEYHEYLLKNIVEKRKKDIDESVLALVEKYFIISGRKKEYIDFCIEYFSLSDCYNSADSRFDEVIKPNVSNFTKAQFEKYVEVVCNNSQICDRRRSNQDNNYILEKLIRTIDLNISYFEQFKYFRFDKKIFNKEINKNSESNELISENLSNVFPEDDLPF